MQIKSPRTVTGSASFAKFLGAFPKLRSLHLGVDTNPLRDLGAVHGLTQLTALVLQFPFPVYMDQTAAYTALFSALPRLRHLELRVAAGWGFDYTVTDVALAVLCQLPLEHLTLQWCNVSATALSRLAQLTGLTHLDIAKSKLDDTGLAAVAQLPRLTYLDISHSSVTDAGIAALAQPATTSCLRALDLAFLAPLTGAGLAHVGRLVGLRFLSLDRCCRLNASDLQYLSPLASSLKRLSLLGMYNIGNEYGIGYVHLAKLTALQDLNLSDIGLTCAAFSPCTALTALTTLSFSVLRDDVVAVVCQLRAIRKLILTDWHKPHRGALTDSMLHGLGCLPHLGELDLDCYYDGGLGLNRMTGVFRLERDESGHGTCLVHRGGGAKGV
jgi:hypothetical protein